MPCSDGTTSFDDPDVIKHIDKLTSLLCEAVGKMEQSSVNFRYSDELREWWIEHQRIDAEHKAQEIRRKL